MNKTAAILMALLTIAGPAQAYVVSKEVGPLLIEVQKMVRAKDYKSALTKLDAAEVVKVTADDETVITSMRQAVRNMQAQQAHPSHP